MLTDVFLKLLEEKAQKVANGPDFTNKDPEYWAQWGSFLGDYVQLLTPAVVVELIHMAQGKTQVSKGI